MVAARQQTAISRGLLLSRTLVPELRLVVPDCWIRSQQGVETHSDKPSVQNPALITVARAANLGKVSLEHQQHWPPLLVLEMTGTPIAILEVMRANGRHLIPD